MNTHVQGWKGVSHGLMLDDILEKVYFSIYYKWGGAGKTGYAFKEKRNQMGIIEQKKLKVIVFTLCRFQISSASALQHNLRLVIYYIFQSLQDFKKKSVWAHSETTTAGSMYITTTQKITMSRHRMDADLFISI